MPYRLKTRNETYGGLIRGGALTELERTLVNFVLECGGRGLRQPTPVQEIDTIWPGGLEPSPSFAGSRVRRALF